MTVKIPPDCFPKQTMATAGRVKIETRHHQTYHHANQPTKPLENCFCTLQSGQSFLAVVSGPKSKSAPPPPVKYARRKKRRAANPTLQPYLCLVPSLLLGLSGIWGPTEEDTQKGAALSVYRAEEESKTGFYINCLAKKIGIWLQKNGFLDTLLLSGMLNPWWNMFQKAKEQIFPAIFKTCGRVPKGTPIRRQVIDLKSGFLLLKILFSEIHLCRYFFAVQRWLFVSIPFA